MVIFTSKESGRVVSRQMVPGESLYGFFYHRNKAFNPCVVVGLLKINDVGGEVIEDLDVQQDKQSNWSFQLTPGQSIRAVDLNNSIGSVRIF